MSYHTYRGGNINIFTNVKNRCLDVLPEDCVGDLTETRDFVKLRQVLSGRLYDLITADGCRKATIGNNENDNLLVVRRELELIDRHVALGGNAILKVFDLHNTEQRRTIWDVAAGFDRVEFYRSPFTRRISGEFYVLFLKRRDNKRKIRRTEKNVLVDFLDKYYKAQKEAIVTGMEMVESAVVGKRAVGDNTAEHANIKFVLSALGAIYYHLDRMVFSKDSGFGYDTGKLGNQSVLFCPLKDKPTIVNKVCAKKIGHETYSQIKSAMDLGSRPFCLFECNTLIAFYKYRPERAFEDLREMDEVFGGFCAEDEAIEMHTDNIDYLKGLVAATDLKHTLIVAHQETERGVLERAAERERARQEQALGWLHCGVDLELPESSRHIRARNALQEQIYAWDAVTPLVRENYVTYYENFSLNVTCFGLKYAVEVLGGASEKLGLIDNVNSKYILRPETGDLQYEFAFDGRTFVKLTYPSNSGKGTPIGYEKPSAKTDVRYLMVGDSTRLMQSEKLARVAKSVNFDGLQLPNIILVRGVPGCGKTKDIVDAHKRTTASEKGDLILSSSAENTQELRERSERSDDRLNYRTTHSYILNAKGNERKYKRVFIDEALMLHAGEIVLIAALSECNEMILMGDLFQIPYINRYTGLKIMRSSLEGLYSQVIERKVSYRCPRDVVLLWRSKYGQEGFYTTSTVDNSMDVIHVQEPNEIIDRKGKFITFKQSEKFQLQKLGFDCSTVHEYQGKQGPIVSIFRASPREAEFIYKSEPHMLVATTRHTKKLTYYTNCVTDPLSQLIGKKFDTKELESAYVPNKETKERRLVDVLKGLHLRGGADMISSSDDYLPDWRWKINDRVDHRFIDVAYYAHQEQYAPEALELLEKRSNEMKNIRNKLRCENPRVEILQDWYDTILPGNSIHDDLEKDNYKINTQDFLITVDSVEIDPTRGTYVEPVKEIIFCLYKNWMM